MVAAGFWAVAAFGSSAWLLKSGSGQREGGAGMAAAFVYGPIGALIGLVLGGWLVWQVLAMPGRSGMVGLCLVGGLVAVVAGISYGLSPAVVEREDFGPGVRPEFQVEVRFPEADAEALGAAGRVVYQLRSVDETMEAVGAVSRHEEGSAVVAGSFRIREFLRDKMFAVMVNGRQRVSWTLNVGVEANPEPVWSPWETMKDSGLAVRFRVVVPAGG